MNKNRIAGIFLSFLLTLLTFIVGVRYGGYIERINKRTAALLSSTPAPRPSPSQTPAPLTFSHLADTCGVSFLYPNTLTPADISSTSARLTDTKITKIAVSCAPPASDPGAGAARNVKIGQLKITGRMIQTPEGAQVFFTATHPLTRQKISFFIQQDLLPLIESSLTFTR
jgi:hypothetical protein